MGLGLSVVRKPDFLEIFIFSDYVIHLICGKMRNSSKIDIESSYWYQMEGIDA